MNLPPSEILYVSFDEVPAPKGASAHITAFVERLGSSVGPVLLVTPGPGDQPPREFAKGVTQLVLGCPGDNPIGRARTFAAKLLRLLRGQAFRVMHFRSIFEGWPLIDPAVRGNARLLYEANGFPSIELKYHYANLAGHRETLDKMARQELACLLASDAIVTVSDVNRQHIVARTSAVDPAVADRIVVIRNGVHLDRFPFQSPSPPTSDRPLQILYFGTLAPWQGIETLLEAVEMASQQRACELTVVGPAGQARRQHLLRRTARLGLNHRVRWIPALDQAALCRELHQAHLSVVPLLAVDRNLLQGCSPLKLLESMAAGCPVVASDLPIVREIAQPMEHYWPARAGDARNLKNQILAVAEDYPLATRMATAARRLVETGYSWSHATDRLLDVYAQLLTPSSRARISDSREPSSSGECSETAR